MKKNAILVRDDNTKTQLEELLRREFETVKIVLKDHSCPECRQHAGTEYFIKDLVHKDNPLFRVTHPNCNCEFEAVKESHPNHEHYKTYIGYKLKEKEFKEKGNKPLIPSKQEDKTIDKIRMPTDDKYEIDNKIEQTEKEIVKTEDRIKDIEKNEEIKEESGRERTPTPGSKKEELSKFLDRIKEFLRKLRTDKTKQEIDRTEEKLINIEEEPTGVGDRLKRSLREYLDKAKKTLYELIRNK